MIRAIAVILALLFACPALAQGCGAGNPNCVVPTAPIGDNSNRAASTAFVQNVVSSEATHFAAGGVSTGSANAQVIANTLPPVFSFTGDPTVSFVAGYSNTGATTLNVASSGVKSVFKKTPAGLVALATGDIVVNQQYLVTYDGTQFELQNPSTVPAASVPAINLGATGNGGITGITPNASYSTTSFVYSGFSSSSASMAGAGVSACRITPAYSGRIAARFDISNSGSNTGAFGVIFSMRYADNAVTSAPAAGAAAAGTTIAGPFLYSSGTGSTWQVSMSAVIAGLTIGHTYWFDYAITSNGSSVQSGNADCNGFEF